MFRKTFIRLILVTAVATGSLLVFAATRPVAHDNEECNEVKEEKTQQRSDFMILESIGLTMMKAASR